mmetsp:Transcript_586/g.1366  ORF Transcript_586/g.1366 Transcript_586/m.1366 type:complete len:240 (+) Transcript_586:174-893(+)
METREARRPGSLRHGRWGAVQRELRTGAAARVRHLQVQERQRVRGRVPPGHDSRERHYQVPRQPTVRGAVSREQEERGRALRRGKRDLRGELHGREEGGVWRLCVDRWLAIRRRVEPGSDARNRDQDRERRPPLRRRIRRRQAAARNAHGRASPAALQRLLGCPAGVKRTPSPEWCDGAKYLGAPPYCAGRRRLVRPFTEQRRAAHRRRARRGGLTQRNSNPHERHAGSTGSRWHWEDP